MNDPRRLALAAGLALAICPAAAAAGPLSQLSVDHVRVRGNRHEVAVRALDAEGRAVPGLERSLRVLRDGIEAESPDVRSPFSREKPVTVGVVVDGELLRSDSPDSGPFMEMLRALASGLTEADRVRVFSAGRSVKQREWGATQLREDVEAVRDLGQEGAPRLRDAIHDGLAATAARNEGSTRALIVVTRARDQGSRHNAAELVVAAMRRGGITSVEVWRLGGGGDEGLSGQLERLCSGTGGRLLRERPAALAVATDAVALASRYTLAFTAERGRDGSEPHRITVRGTQDGRTLEHTIRYTNDGASDPAWWASPLVWLVLVGCVALLAVLLWLLQPRQLALLVVQGGEEDGQWYEVFALPTRVGAREDNDILVAGPTISGVHCLLEREGRRIVLVDQGSQYGTFVNEERVTRQVLEDEDVIRLGNDVELVYEAR